MNRSISNVTRPAAWLVPWLALAACAPANGAPGAAQGGAAASAPGQGGSSGTTFSADGVETCNGLDDNGDGVVDEGCPCAPGTTQPCYAGPAGAAGVGACVMGTQSCESSNEGEFASSRWGACVGSVLPAAESCGGGVDANCDGQIDTCGAGGGAGTGGGACQPGQTQSCYDGPMGTKGVGICASGTESCQTNGTWGPCVGETGPAPEVCGNGIDEDCDGSDETCDVVDVSVFLLGDCLTASCPADHPHPVGCSVFFTPGDDRGCVANAPGSAVVYFQAGDQCNAGLVTGTLHCSKSAAAPLDGASCPINKPIPIYASSPSGCPAVH